MNSSKRAPARRHIPRFDDTLVIKVDTPSPTASIEATAYPHDLLAATPFISAIVSWEGVNAMMSIVKTEADCEPWTRCVQLLWAVLGPASAPEDLQVNASTWSKLTVTMPDVETQQVGRVVVSLDRETWIARLSRPNIGANDTEIDVPVELRTLDAGSLLVHVTCLLILGFPFS